MRAAQSTLCSLCTNTWLKFRCSAWAYVTSYLPHTHTQTHFLNRKTQLIQNSHWSSFSGWEKRNKPLAWCLTSPLHVSPSAAGVNSSARLDRHLCWNQPQLLSGGWQLLFFFFFFCLWNRTRVSRFPLHWSYFPHTHARARAQQTRSELHVMFRGPTCGGVKRLCTAVSVPSAVCMWRSVRRSWVCECVCVCSQPWSLQRTGSQAGRQAGETGPNQSRAQAGLSQCCRRGHSTDLLILTPYLNQLKRP